MLARTLFHNQRKQSPCSERSSSECVATRANRGSEVPHSSREEVLLERGGAVDQQVVDLGEVAGAVLGGQILEGLPNTLTANNRFEPRWVAADHKLDDLGCSSASHRRGLPSASMEWKQGYVS